MTSAVEPEQPIAPGAESPPGTGSGGLILLPASDGVDAGMCINGACRLPSAKN